MGGAPANFQTCTWGTDPATGEYVMLGKTFKGLTDVLLEWQTGNFWPGRRIAISGLFMSGPSS